MGRASRVPVSTDDGNKLVKPTKIGNGAQTPYYPRDVRWDVLERLGFDSYPAFADDQGGR